jgi:hypothetical protein
MKINHPPATITLTTAELHGAIVLYLESQNTVLDGLRLGGLVATDFTTMQLVSSPRSWLSGSVTFELLPESKP